MATYSTDYPALAPLGSGAPDSPAAAIAAGDPVSDAHMEAASRQNNRRRVLWQSDTPRATLEELNNAKKREFQVLAENAAGATAAPAWAIAMQKMPKRLLRRCDSKQSDWSK